MSAIADEAEPPVTPGAGARDPRTTIAGRYAIDLTAPLAADGNCLLYRGQDLRTRQDVAVKALRIEYRRDPETRARFRREARLLAFLAHPNVIRVVDFVEDRGTSWVVLEHLPGRSLTELVAERGPLPPEEVAGVLDQAAAALGHLHGRGLVHLAVTPQTLRLTPDGTVKLIDFGLAQPAGGLQATITGRAIGAAPYLAPEQVCGDPVHAATDIFALGCVVYELLTGRPPFAPAGPGDVANEAIRARLERAPAPPSHTRPDLELPKWVDDVVLWALAREPTARYDSAEAFARLFRAGVHGEPPGPTAAPALVEVPVRRRAARPANEPPAPPSPAAVVVPTHFGRRPAAVERLTGAGEHPVWRSPAVRHRLWRAVAAVGAIDLLLAVLLILTQGALPGLYEPSVALGPGATARVVVDGLPVRAAPSPASPPLGHLAAGARLTITGPSVLTDGETWWPVALSGDAVEGYAAATGLRPVRPATPWDRLREAFGRQ